MFYTEIEEARAEAKKRFRDKNLKSMVEDYLGELPLLLKEQAAPRAVIARQIATPNHESLRFWEMTSGNGLKPVWFEYSEDLFCSANIDKVFLGKLVFYHGKGRRGGDKTQTLKVINLNQPSNRRICDIRLRNNQGKKLPDIHHVMFKEAFTGSEPEIFDMSSWIKKMGGRADKYYAALFSLFICHGVLFENFLGKGAEGAFVNDVVLPAFEEVSNRFEVKPLIVRLIPEESERDNYWCWYPGELQKCIQEQKG